MKRAPLAKQGDNICATLHSDINTSNRICAAIWREDVDQAPDGTGNRNQDQKIIRDF